MREDFQREETRAGVVISWLLRELIGLSIIKTLMIISELGYE